MRVNKRAYSILVRKTLSEETTGDLGVDGRITCKHILKNQFVMSEVGGQCVNNQRDAQFL